jgi:hypothetical protein
MSSVLGSEAGFVERRVADRRQARRPEPGSAWRSGGEILGYALWASDGPVGEITDLVFEADSLCVTEIVAHARRFFLSERLCVPLHTVKRVDALRRRVDVRLTRAEIRQLARLTSPSGSRAARS